MKLSVDTYLHNRWSKLRFDEPYETQFKTEYIKKALFSDQISLAIVTVLIAAFGLIDPLLFPETKNFTSAIRFTIMVPSLVIFYSLTFFDYFKARMQMLVVLVVFILGAGSSIIIANSYQSEPGHLLYFPGLLFVIIGTYTMARLRFWNSVFAGFLITLVYEISALLTFDTKTTDTYVNDLNIFLSNNFYIISAHVLGMWTSWSKEVLHRANFLQKQIIQQESEERALINESLLNKNRLIEEQSAEIHRRTLMLSDQNKLLEEQKKAIENKNLELEDVNASKDKFFSIIAHDLRNPFNTIIANSHPMLNQITASNTPQIEKRIGAIHESAQGAYKLLENLLEWARSKTGRIEFQPTTILIDTLFDISYNLAENMARTKNIELHFDKNGVESIYGDMNMIRTILRNLLSNAIKFTSQGGEVTVRAAAHNGGIIISVKDNGIGISPENLSRLFRINSRVSEKGTENETGTGLGLLLCKEFVDKHCGKIWGESENGKGSEFFFSLPFPQTEADKPEA